MRRYQGRQYKKVQVIGHPRADSSGRVGEHVLIAEKALGKYLDSKHPIHHFDGNKRNNRNSNLVVCEDEDYHRLLHIRTRIFKAGGNPNTDKICTTCKQPKHKREYSSNIATKDGKQQSCKHCSNEIYRNNYSHIKRKR